MELAKSEEKEENKTNRGLFFRVIKKKASRKPKYNFFQYANF